MYRRTRKPAAVVIPELRRAKYLDCRAIRGSDFVVTDLALYPVSTSAELRAAADKALEAELEASLSPDDEDPFRCIR